MTWADELWKIKPGVPTVGAANALTAKEREALLAFAKGGQNEDAAAVLGVTHNQFQQSGLPRIRGKLHVFTTPRLVAEGYRTGALALAYDKEQGIPQGAADAVPEFTLRIWGLIVEGLNNEEIVVKLDSTMGQVRSKIKRLGDVMSVAPKMGGRNQLASRYFEFGLAEGDFSRRK
jgi:DNA-binding CsgD family transcriptional regulator